MVLLIDNYDSFSYNLYQQAAAVEPDIRVARNDTLTIGQIDGLNPSHILLSPGPGYPKDAGICEEIVRKLGGFIPILGVCLGHQAVCEAYGAEIVHAERLMHGKASLLRVNNTDPLFTGLPGTITAARYHSLAAKVDTLPACLRVLAEDEGGAVMAVRHREKPVYGVQFHPESILTPQGGVILRNFLSL
ncbi:anthranilate synthase component II [Agathobaculum sp.]|uniref:anthranilate synthase component II n=1 Tax=Agathobaculum sp. TaxID=2048138 RepID=UPI002A80A144|nr:aminodeoxychorismate/anthranilate synthase component II [Agathobaculum sp.]MDY3619383.1 aminodeoxychorismate/anthranilate synthase component II [Agathobaculum sp.]